MRHWHKSSKKIHVVSVPTVGLCVCPWLDLSAVKTLTVPLDIQKQNNVWEEWLFRVAGAGPNVCQCWTNVFVSLCVQCFWKNKVNCIPLKELEEGWCDPRAQRCTLSLPKYLDKGVGTKWKSNPFQTIHFAFGELVWTLKYFVVITNSCFQL